MDQTKENETRLPPPTDGEPVDDDRETDQGTESRDDTRNEKMETASNPVPDAPHVAPESESETESADEIKNEKKRPEVQAADQPAGETAETANKYEGQGDAKSDAPGPDNAPGAEDSIASPAADPSDEDSRIADTGSEEADPEPPSESDDGIESAGDKSESAEDGKEAQPSEKSSDNEKEDVDPTRKASNDLSKFGGYKIGDENEDRDPAEETREPAGDDSPEKEQPGPQPDGAESELENVSEPEPVRKMPLAKAVVTVILLAAVFSGFFIFENKSNRKPARKATATEVDKPIGSKADYPKTAAAIQPDDPNYIYYAKVEEISVLRETLLRKEEEIEVGS